MLICLRKFDSCRFRAWADGTDGCPADSYPASGWIVTNSARIAFLSHPGLRPGREWGGLLIRMPSACARPSSTLGELISYDLRISVASPSRGRIAAVGELESPPRCQRGDRGFEPRRWRLRRDARRGARGVLREALNLARRVRASPPLMTRESSAVSNRMRITARSPVWPSDRASPFQGEDAGLIPAIGSRASPPRWFELCSSGLVSETRGCLPRGPGATPGSCSIVNHCPCSKGGRCLVCSAVRERYPARAPPPSLVDPCPPSINGDAPPS